MKQFVKIFFITFFICLTATAASKSLQGDNWKSSDLTKTFVPPSASTTLLGTDTSQTLTNKIISGSNNTISNIALSTDVTGVLPLSNGGTGQTTQTAAFNGLSPLTTKGDLIVRNASGDNTRKAVGADGYFLTADSSDSTGVKWVQQSVTSVAGTLPIANGGTGQTTQTAAFNGLSPLTTKGDLIGVIASGDNTRIAVGTDGQVLTADSTQATGLKWGSATGGGAVNLITNGDADNAASSIFVPYADAAASRPVDGTGGSPNVTTAVTSTAPLTGTKSFTITKDAVNRQGQGWSIPFTVPLSMQAKVLQIEVDYIVNSGTFVAGSSSVDSDVIWYLYDVTNSTLIEPSSIKLLSNSSTLSDKFRSTFQTSATGTSYRLIAHVASTSAAAYELKVETSVSPSVYVYGTPITDWKAYTPAFTNFGTVTGINFRSRRVGSDEEISGVFTTGTTVAAEARISLPTGLVSASSLPTLSKAGDMGSALAEAASWQINIEPSVTYLTMGKQGAGSAGFTKGNGNSWVSSTAYSLIASVPIQGRSSSVQMSDQTDTRVVAASYYGHNSTAFADNTYTTIQFNTKLEDTHAMFSAGTTTIKVAGIYEIDAAVAFVIGGYGANNLFNLRVRVNGATDYLLDRLINTSSLQPNVTKGSIRLPLKVGDTVVIQAMKTNWGGVSGLDTDLTQTRMSIVRVSGPSAIAASESVNLSYSTSAGNSVGTSETLILFATKQYDSHGAYNTSTGLFTAPIAGKYRVSVTLTSASFTLGTTQQFVMQIYKNGSVFRRPARVAGSGGAVNLGLCGNTTVDLLAGETLSIYASSTVATTLVAGVVENNFSIERVGN